jgi:hypothetical protein
MGAAKRKKANGTYPEQTFTPKVMVATKEDISTAYIQRMSKLGYVMLVIAIPDEEAHGKGSSQNLSIFGNIPDTAMQVAVMREVADKIEDSYEAGQKKEKLVDIQ